MHSLPITAVTIGNAGMANRVYLTIRRIAKNQTTWKSSLPLTRPDLAMFGTDTKLERVIKSEATAFRVAEIHHLQTQGLGPASPGSIRASRL